MSINEFMTMGDSLKMSRIIRDAPATDALEDELLEFVNGLISTAYKQGRGSVQNEIRTALGLEG